MDLRKPHILSKSLSNAYRFLIDYQISRIIINTDNLNDALSEYIYYMNQNYNMYIDRIGTNRLNKKSYAYHTANFASFTRGNDITDDELRLVTDFYEELLSYTDRIIHEKFCIGKKFSKHEIKMLDHNDYEYKLIDSCYYKKIYIRIPKELFDKNEYYEYCDEYEDEDNDENVIKSIHKIDNCYVICFDNTNKKFCGSDISNILDSCSNYAAFKINYISSTNSKLFIDVYYND